MPIWHVPVVLNLLPPAVACTWVGWLASSYRLFVTNAELISLGLAVWLIYTLDGLLDSRGRMPGSTATPRRDFHLRHRAMLWIIWVMVAGGTLSFSLGSIGSGLALSGMVLGLFILLYLMHAQKIRRASRTWLPKEIFGGFLFAIGVGLVLMEARGRGVNGPVSPAAAMASFSEGIGSGLLWLLASAQFVLANIVIDPAVPMLGLLFSTNCLLTSLSEWRADKQVDDASAARLAPRLLRMAPMFAAALTVSSTINAITATIPGMARIFMAIAISAGLMAIVYLLAKRGKISPALCALLLDAALLSPLILMPMGPPDGM